MKIPSNLQTSLPQEFEPESPSNQNTNIGSHNTLNSDSVEKFRQNEFSPEEGALQKQQLLQREQEKQEIIQKEKAEQAEQQAKVAEAEGEGAGTATDLAVGLIPFGIGNWFDGKGTWESDLGKTIISTICPIPFVAGLLANWGGEWLGNALEDSFNWTKTAVSDAVDWTGGALKTVGNGIADGAEDFGEGVADVATSVADDAGDALSDAGDTVSDVFDW
jgi:chorismate synthase